jgi:hypothetical protein
MVRSQVVEKFRALCVNVLENDLDSRKQMESAVGTGSASLLNAMAIATIHTKNWAKTWNARRCSKGSAGFCSDSRLGLFPRSRPCDEECLGKTAGPRDHAV